MRKNIENFIGIGIGIIVLMPITIWLVLFIKGKQFALRDRLKKADAIIVLAGTRGNIKFLDGKSVLEYNFINEAGPHILSRLENLA